MSISSGVGARCPAAGSIRQALNRAIAVVGREFPREGVSCHTTFTGSNCSALRTELMERKSHLLVGREDREYRTLYQALKSCDRFFDVSCPPCDAVAETKARQQWQRDVAQIVGFDPRAPASWSDDPIGELARRVRKLVGPDWAADVGRHRAACLVPDQNGCLETPRKLGGTLATATEHCSEQCRQQWIDTRGIKPCCIPPSQDLYGLRVGTAKTKGKFRVVTMQSAKVKEVLKPVHDTLYDFLSRRKWLVRGDLLKEHVKLVLEDRRDGEQYISGDYKAATNNIYLPAVEAIVGVLAEAPSLSSEERELLLGSFRAENLHWVSRSGVSHPILRGSMMGNLVSFPVLCLLNKSCFDIACSLRRKRTGEKGYRRPIINGDDIAFCGDEAMYNDWVTVTSHFGLIVNEEKTGRSERFIELNSRSFDCETSRFLRKPVLACLAPGSDPSCLLTRLWDGLKTLSPGTLRWVIVTLRHHIARREINLSNLPKRLRRVLIKERWFRAALLVEPRVVTTGIDRHWPVVSRDFRPSPECMEVYHKAQRTLLSLGVKLARGKLVRPREVFLSRDSVREVAPPKCQFRLVTTWGWRWTKPLLNWWENLGLPTVSLGRGAWEEEHQDLFIKVSVELSYPGVPPPSSLLFDTVRPDGVNWV